MSEIGSPEPNLEVETSDGVSASSSSPLPSLSHLMRPKGSAYTPPYPKDILGRPLLGSRHENKAQRHQANTLLKKGKEPGAGEYNIPPQSVNLSSANVPTKVVPSATYASKVVGAPSSATVKAPKTMPSSSGSPGGALYSAVTSLLPVQPRFFKSFSADAVTVNFSRFGLDASSAIKLVHEQIVGAEAVKFLPVSQVLEVAFSSAQAAREALQKGVELKGARAPMTRCYHPSPNVIPVSILGLPIFAKDLTEAELKRVLLPHGVIVDIVYAVWGGTGLRADSCEILLDTSPRRRPTGEGIEIVHTPCAPLERQIIIHGAPCTVRWRSTPPHQASTAGAGGTPLLPREDPVWGPTAKAARQKSWEAFKAAHASRPL